MAKMIGVNCPSCGRTLLDSGKNCVNCGFDHPSSIQKLQEKHHEMFIVAAENGHDVDKFVEGMAEQTREIGRHIESKRN